LVLNNKSLDLIPPEQTLKEKLDCHDQDHQVRLVGVTAVKTCSGGSGCTQTAGIGHDQELPLMGVDMVADRN
jgi:hypothetical protein